METTSLKIMSNSLHFLSLSLRFSDTEKLYMEATKDVAAKYGRNYTWEMEARVMGSTPLDSAKMMLEMLQLPLTQEEYTAEMNSLYAKLFPTADLMPGRLPTASR